MNLVTCGENCRWQDDGNCCLCTDAPIGTARVNGCSYFQAKASAERMELHENKGILPKQYPKIKD